VHLADSKNVYKLIGLVTNETDAVGLDENAVSGMDAVEEVDTSDQGSGVVVSRAPTPTAEQSPSEHGDSKESNATNVRSAPPNALPRQPSVNTQELMSIAATLKDSSDREAPGEKVPDNEPTKPVKPDGAPAAATKSADTELFLAHFWDGNESEGDSSSPPTVIDSFSCAYWPRESEGHFSPLLHGRLFVTSSAMYFIGWGDKKIVLKWEDVTAISKATNMMGALDNSLRVAYENGDGESSYFFGSFAFREDAFQIMSRLSTVARSLKDIKGNKPVKKDAPPDEVLKKMEVVLKKKIKNTSIKTFYEACWSEGNRTDAAPFYGPFLIEKKSHDVEVGDWEFADGKGFQNKWSEEHFPQKRVVTFKFKRTTHLYVGPPIAGVTQTQYCFVEGDDKCIIEMTVEMDGIPYADVFAVEVRWVARRVGNKDLLIEVGVFVDFKKSSMLASKIRSGTIHETKPIHFALFDAVKAACAAAGPTEEEDEEGEEELEEEMAEEKETEGRSISNFILSRVSALLSAVNMHGFLTKLKQVGLTPWDKGVPQQASILVGLGLVLVLLTRLTTPKSFGSTVSENDIQDLNERMDILNTEMAEIKVLLEELLSVMKKSK